MTLWTAADAAAATGGRAITPWQATGISIDTRSLQPGDLFIALSAARDGHDFVADALAKGAAAAMVSYVPNGVAADAPLLIVPDVMAALHALGAAGRARSHARVIGITGSVGKTSTKDMAREMLAEFGKVHAAEASFNNHWGVPITLACLPQDADFAIVEMGMSNAGEIAPLTALTRPNVAIVTAVAPAHLESLGSLDAIAHEKASIFAGLEPGGSAIFPADLPTSPILETTARKHAATSLPFGAGDVPLHLHDLRQTETALVMRAKIGRMALAVRLMNSGAHAASNALACLGAAYALGLDLARAALALGRWQPPAGRGLRQRILLDPVEEASFTLIDDAFNANPASMAAALSLLAQTKPAPGGRRIAILGDMLELGPEEDAMHAALAADPAMSDIRLVHCVGTRMGALHAALPLRQRGRWVALADALLDHVHNLASPGDVVLVKGSKGSRVSRVVDAFRGLDTASSHKKGS